jgi:hypothetical protein
MNLSILKSYLSMNYQKNNDFGASNVVGHFNCRDKLRSN